jgi:hypothetical protein
VKTYIEQDWGFITVRENGRYSPLVRRQRMPATPHSPESVYETIAAGAVVAHTLGKDILWDVTGREPDAALAKEFQSHLDRLPAGWSLDESQIRDWLRERTHQLYRDDEDRGR